MSKRQRYTVVVHPDKSETWINEESGYLFVKDPKGVIRVRLGVLDE